MEFIDEKIQQWKDMEPKFKVLIGSVVVLGMVVVYITHSREAAMDAAAEKKRLDAAAKAEASVKGESFKLSALPNSNRNQGLEDMHATLLKLSERLDSYERNGVSPARPQPTSTAQLPSNASPTVDLNATLPPASGANAPSGGVDFTLSSMDPPKSSGKGKEEATQEVPSPVEMQVWAAQGRSAKDKEKPSEPKIVIPVNSGLQGVMLTGINARPSGATSGALGSATSANNVGAPFVTRVKGDAILPNKWKLSDLGDCFLGGSAVAVLSAERAYAISDTISCIAPNGDVYEGPVKAYGVDADGIQGLAGKVVSKQGAILAQAFLTGIASGLGSALTPTQVPGYNSTATGGNVGYQTPDPNMVARSAVGTGISNASAQLSRFYLDFAKETFPVIEIPALTRITWILKESVELKRTKKGA